MKRYLQIIMVAMALSAWASFSGGVLTGCASGQVDPGSDAFVVEAEKDLRTAFHVVDGFLEWEALNRSSVGADVTAVADALRRDFPASYASAQEVFGTYKENRTPENRASLSTWLATLNSAMVRALGHMPNREATTALKAANVPIHY